MLRIRRANGDGDLTRSVLLVRLRRATFGKRSSSFARHLSQETPAETRARARNVTRSYGRMSLRERVELGEIIAGKLKRLSVK